MDAGRPAPLAGPGVVVGAAVAGRAAGITPGGSYVHAAPWNLAGCACTGPCPVADGNRTRERPYSDPSSATLRVRRSPRARAVAEPHPVGVPDSGSAGGRGRVGRRFFLKSSCLARVRRLVSSSRCRSASTRRAASRSCRWASVSRPAGNCDSVIEMASSISRARTGLVAYESMDVGLTPSLNSRVRDSGSHARAVSLRVWTRTKDSRVLRRRLRTRANCHAPMLTAPAAATTRMSVRSEFIRPSHWRGRTIAAVAVAPARPALPHTPVLLSRHRGALLLPSRSSRSRTRPYS